MKTTQLYRASIFGDFKKISPAPENMIRLLEILKGYDNFMPVTLPPPPQNTPSPMNSVQPEIPSILFINTDQSQTIIIGAHRIDISYNSIDNAGIDLSNRTDKINTMHSILSKISDAYNLSVTRLALFTINLTLDPSDTEKENIETKIRNTISKYSNDNLPEWAVRLMKNESLPLDGNNIVLNIITCIEKNTFQKNNSTENAQSGYKFDFDINTSVDKNPPSTVYSSEELKVFLKYADSITEEIYSDINS